MAGRTHSLSSWLTRFAMFVTIVGLGLTLATPRASAAGYYGPNPDYAPSVFTYGFRGMLTGGLVGLSGGYLVARHDGFEGDDWRAMTYGVGIGALSGGVLGLTLGFIDLADDVPGRGNIALRDTLYGAGFGAAAGAIGGGLAAINTKDAEHVLFGAAIGTLAGAGIGVIVGLIEGRRIVDSPAHRYPSRGIRPTLFATRDSGNDLVWITGATGRF